MLLIQQAGALEQAGESNGRFLRQLHPIDEMNRRTASAIIGVSVQWFAKVSR
jgi:hypothetical protein